MYLLKFTYSHSFLQASRKLLILNTVSAFVPLTGFELNNNNFLCSALLRYFVQVCDFARNLSKCKQRFRTTFRPKDYFGEEHV